MGKEVGRDVGRWKEAFTAEPAIETWLYVHEIAKTDKKLKVEVFTRDRGAARYALEALKDCIEECIELVKVGKFLIAPQGADPDGTPHFGDSVEYPLDIPRPGG